jgi:hypothetical protein
LDHPIHKLLFLLSKYYFIKGSSELDFIKIGKALSGNQSDRFIKSDSVSNRWSHLHNFFLPFYYSKSAFWLKYPFDCIFGHIRTAIPKASGHLAV